MATPASRSSVPITAEAEANGCNTSVYFIYFKAGVRGVAILKRHGDGLDGFIDVQHLSVLYAVGVGPPKAKDLELAEFVFSARNRGDLRRTDIQSDDDGLLFI